MPLKNQETHWAYWGIGTLCSLLALGVPHKDVELYGAFGILTFLFYWGLLSVEKNRDLTAEAYSEAGPLPGIEGSQG